MRCFQAHWCARLPPSVQPRHQGFVPTNPLKAGIRVALRPSTAHRVEQTVRMINMFSRRQALGAKLRTGGMTRQRPYANQAAVINLDNTTASLPTLRAKRD